MIPLLGITVDWTGLIKEGKFSPKWAKAFPSSRRRALGSYGGKALASAQDVLCVEDSRGGRVECSFHRPVYLLTALAGIGS